MRKYVKFYCIKTYKTYEEFFTEGCIYYGFPNNYGSNKPGYDIFVNDGNNTPFLMKDNSIPGNGGSYLGMLETEMREYLITLGEYREHRINEILE